jgi:hypothetical protein
LAAPSGAWDTVPHQRITKAALDALPQRARNRFGPEIAALVEIYCMYPDRYLEMDRYGFVRKSAGPRSAEEIRIYCVRPDGEAVHGASGDRESDVRSVAWLLDRIAASRPPEAAKYAGVLSHFIADSLSPPHSVASEELQGWGLNVHAAIERSVPEFTLAGYTPRPITAAEVVDRCYIGAARNRRDLPFMVKAACTGDDRALDPYRLRAATEAARILAGALFRRTPYFGDRLHNLEISRRVLIVN